MDSSQGQVESTGGLATRRLSSVCGSNSGGSSDEVVSAQTPLSAPPYLVALMSVVWGVSTCSLLAVILFVNLDNNSAANGITRVLQRKVEEGIMDATLLHSKLNTDVQARARNVLIAVSVVVAIISVVIVPFLVARCLLQSAGEIEESLRDMTHWFNMTATCQFEKAPLYVCSPQETRALTEVQTFIAVPFSTVPEMIDAQVELARANLLLREYRKLLPPGCVEEAQLSTPAVVAAVDDDDDDESGGVMWRHGNVATSSLPEGGTIEDEKTGRADCAMSATTQADLHADAAAAVCKPNISTPFGQRSDASSDVARRALRGSACTTHIDDFTFVPPSSPPTSLGASPDIISPTSPFLIQHDEEKANEKTVVEGVSGYRPHLSSSEEAARGTASVLLSPLLSISRRVSLRHGMLSTTAGTAATTQKASPSVSAAPGTVGVVTSNIGLRPYIATVLVVSFPHFFSIACNDKQESSEMGRTFLSAVLQHSKKFGGRLLQCRPDCATIVWNTRVAQPQPGHSHRGLLCGKMLIDSLQTYVRQRFSDTNALDVFSPVAVAFTAPVFAGTVGTETERHHVVHGPLVQLASELHQLLYYLNVRFTWIDAPPAHKPSGTFCVPFDIITDASGQRHVLHEVTSAVSEGTAHDMQVAFDVFARGEADSYKAAARLYGLIVQREHNTAALRLRQLSCAYAMSGGTYARPVPQWKLFEVESGVNGGAGVDQDEDLGDVSTRSEDAAGSEGAAKDGQQPAAHVALSSHRRQQRRFSMSTSGVPRSHQTMMEEIRREIQMATNSTAPLVSTAAGTAHESVGTIASAPRACDTTACTTVDTPNDSCQIATDTDVKNRVQSLAINALATGPTTSDSVAEEEKVSTPKISRPKLSLIPPTSTIDFTDKQGMAFRRSGIRLGQTPTSEVYLGLSYTGGLVAIKIVNLFVVDKSSEADVSPVGSVNHRRMRRKGISVIYNAEAAVAAVVNEVELLAATRHQCVVGYITSVVADGKLLVVMEYVSGGSLRRVLSQFTVSVPISQARVYLKDVLRGLHYLHKRGIIHRDIKPQNVLVPTTGPCKLADFGISKELSKATADVHADGTPFYMAPEAAQGQAVPKSDIWSFGIMLAEVLTRRLPWPEGSNPIYVRYQLARNSDFAPSVEEGSIPADALEVFQACTRRDPELRPSAEEVLRMPFFGSLGKSIRGSM